MCKIKANFHTLGENRVDFHTANVYRELQGYYREIELQGIHIYRNILGVTFASIITFIFNVRNMGILMFLHVADIWCIIYREILLISTESKQKFQIQIFLHCQRDH